MMNFRQSINCSLSNWISRLRRVTNHAATSVIFIMNAAASVTATPEMNPTTSFSIVCASYDFKPVDRTA